MLVFERGGELYRMTVDGFETVRLTTTNSIEADPDVSADGLNIAFTRGSKLHRDEVWVSDPGWWISAPRPPCASTSERTGVACGA